jgi:hypothetical protein
MAYFAGLDVSVKETSACIVDDAGKIVREARVSSEPEAILQVLPPKTMGRPLGVPNKLTRIIKEAILLAGEAQGNKLARANEEVPEGLVSYF